MKSKILKKFRQVSFTAKIILILYFIFTLFMLLIHVYPLFYALNNSLKTTDEMSNSVFALTTTFSFDNYVLMLSKFQANGTFFEKLLWNSVWQTTLWLFANITASTLVAYALSKFRFPGRGFLFGVLIFKETIPLIGSGAAEFKLLYSLNFINNPYVIWIYWFLGFDYSAFILYGTFNGLSNSYAESAKIDGAGETSVFFKIFLPMMYPAIVAILVTNFLTMWNDYTTAQIVLSKYPNLAYGLYLFQSGKAKFDIYAELIFFPALVATALPGVVIYLSMQNIIVKNLTVGGIKG